MSRLRVALLFSVLAQQSNLLISFASVVVVARLLTPAEIGLFAVASALTMIATEIRTFGINQYLVREVDLDDEKRRTALGLMMILSWLLGICVFITAPSISAFYGQPDLRDIFWILSFSFLIAPFATIPFATFLREMRFETIFRIRLVTAIARASGAIYFSWLGWSYFGLALSVVLGSAVELTMISFYDRSKSLLFPSLKRWREVTGFGLNAGVAGMLQRLVQGLPDIVLGRAVTLQEVGMFSRGLGLVLFLDRIITASVGPIILPHLSEIRRNNGNIGHEYLRCIKLHGAVALPAFATAGVVALPLIQLVFGEQWVAAASIAGVLMIWRMFVTINHFLPDALIAAGKEHLLIVRILAMLVSRCILIVLAAPHGLMAVAIAMCLSGAIELIFNSYIAIHALKLSILDITNSFASNAVIALCCYVVATAIHLSLASSTAPSIELFLVTVAVTIIWPVLLKLFDHELWHLGNSVISQSVSKLFKNKSVTRN